MNGLLGEIRLFDKVKQDFKRFFKVAAAGKEVAGAVKGRESVCVCSRFCKKLKGVKLLAFKQLVLKEMRNALRNAGKVLFVFKPEAGVD